MFEINVNGQPFRNWTSIAVTRTLDENTGKFSFRSSNVIPSNYPVRAGDEIQVIINDQPRLTGFCEVLVSAEEDGEDFVTVDGRDNVCDLIDSSMPDAVKNIQGPLSFVDLCNQVVNALEANIGVIQTISDIPDFTELDFFGADAGKNCMDYLTDFARKRQVYLISDGLGNLLIYRPSDALIAGQLIGTQNIKASSIKFNHSARYNKYSSRSQDNFGADPDADYVFGVDRKGEAVDNEIRPSRFLEIQGEESFTELETRDRAVEELNIRKGRSTEYTAVVQGVERAPGVLWDIGQLTKVNDPKRNIKGIFLTRSIQITSHVRRGTSTTITLAPPEAYNVRVPTQGDLRRAQQGPQYQNTQVSERTRRFLRT